MPNSTNAAVNIAAAGDNTVINAPGAGLRIKIVSLILVCGAVVTVTLKSGASTNLTGAMSFAINGGLGFGSDMFPLVLGVNEEFIINLGGAVQVSGIVNYIIGN